MMIAFVIRSRPTKFGPGAVCAGGALASGRLGAQVAFDPAYGLNRLREVVPVGLAGVGGRYDGDASSAVSASANGPAPRLATAARR